MNLEFEDYLRLGLYLRYVAEHEQKYKKILYYR